MNTTVSSITNRAGKNQKSATSQDNKPVIHESERITASDYSNELLTGKFERSLPIALQIHLPFCPIRPLTCHRYAVITHDSSEIDTYLDSLEHEVKLVIEKIGPQPRLQKLQVGGNAPNYLNDSQLVRLVEILANAFVMDDATEMSIEVSARLTSSVQLQLLRGLGFTRITFSIADLDPRVQLAIGHTQSFEMLNDAFNIAREAGFSTLSTDLLYGLPHQSTSSMRRTIKSIGQLAPDRISCDVFRLRTLDFPHQYGIDAKLMPSIADKLALLNVIVEELGADEYNWVGMDYFVRRDDPLSQAQSEHKLTRNWLGYTDTQIGNVLGFGTSSFSEIGSVCVQNHSKLPNWKTSIDTGRLPIREGVRMTPADKRYRDTLTSLMCNLDSDDCSPLLESAKNTRQLNDFRNRGLLEVNGNRISITQQGRYMLPQVWKEALPSHLAWNNSF
jgi:oxygen-independent coproporphyrinogen III oxidase